MPEVIQEVIESPVPTSIVEIAELFKITLDDLLKDEIMCKEFLSDIASIDKNRKPVIQEVQPDKSIYKIGVNRYVGYDRKINTFKKNNLQKIGEAILQFSANSSAGLDFSIAKSVSIAY